MATPTSPWRAKVLEVLADGEWHHVEELVTAGVATVPPGKGYRTGERNRRCKTPGARTRVRGDADTAISAGARQLVVQAIGDLIRRQRVAERSGDQVRLVPTTTDADRKQPMINDP